jgi:uncharacterized protein (TIGR02099 family)
MQTLRTLFRRIRTLLWTALSILVIAAAVLVGVGKLLMPYSERYQPRLETWLSEEFGRPVQLSSFRGEWRAFGPRLTLSGMNLLPEPGTAEGTAKQVAIDSAALDIKPLNLLIPGRPLYNFRVIGADFSLTRDESGQFRLSGWGISGAASNGQSSGLRELAKIGEVILEDSSLTYQDDKAGVHLGLESIRGRLQMDGNRFAMDVEAKLMDDDSRLVFGELEATVFLRLGDDNRLEVARWQASAQELMLTAFQGKLPPNPFLPLKGWLNAELWGDWSREEGHSIRGATDLTEALMVNEYQELNLEHVNMRFNWSYRQRGQWRLDIADLFYDDGTASWTAPSIAMARNTAADIGLWISAEQLPLGVPLNLARDVMSVYGTAWPKFLPRVARGSVSGLDLVLSNAWRLHFAQGAISNARVSEWDRWPDLQGLNGTIALADSSGRISLTAPRLQVDWPRMFRDPLQFEMPGCELDLAWGEAWQVGFDACSLANRDVALEGRVIIRKSDGKPAVDVNVRVDRADVGRLDPYWPEAVMSDNILAWLRRGLVSGKLERGRFQIHGDMDDWPFREGRGRFEALAEVRGVELDYVPDWPPASRVDAVARFEGPSMDIAGTVGSIAGVAVRQVAVDIEDMKQPVLTVGFEADSDLPGLLGFVLQSPLNEKINTDLTRFEFSGPATTSGNLRFPLGKVKGDNNVLGRVLLQGGRFSDPASEVVLENIEGAVTYDLAGFRAEALSATFRGHSAELALSATAMSDEKFRAGMKGRFDVRDVIPEFLLESYSALAQIEGSTDWDVSLVVAADEPGGEAEPVLTVVSGLEGIQLNLPSPLRKAADENWPLVLHYPLSESDSLLDIELADRITLGFDLAKETRSPRSAVVNVGGGAPELPPEGLIRIRGGAAEIDLDGWIDVIVDDAREGKGLGGLELEPSSVAADRLIFLDRRFDDVRMAFELIGNDVKATFTAPDIDGKVSFTRSSGGTNSLTAEFERLKLDDPVSAGMDVETDPADLPALHLYARSFQYAGIELGETRIEAYPDGKGFHFEKVDAQSDRLTVQASGDWSLEGDQHRSDFRINMSSESLGEFLQSLGISSSMHGGQTVVQFNAWWPGSPAAFALSRLNGEVEFSVLQGNIADASPGTGRLLGLLSVQSIPKRLSLDFRDVFDSGFSFDEANGSFTMENGRATTDDVVMKSSAAEISITGSTDLVGQQYDQVLTVRPGLGNTLPVIGAIAGGPIGVAAGLALQGLLHEQLGDATQVQYTITGSWAEPVFEPVIKPSADGS